MLFNSITFLLFETLLHSYFNTRACKAAGVQTRNNDMHFSKSNIRQLQKEEVQLPEQINFERVGEYGRTRMRRLKRPGEPAPAVPLFG